MFCHNLLKILGFIFVYPVSLIMPRNRSLWVFGSNFGFADNPKYLFYDIINNHHEIKAIWIYRKITDKDYFRTKNIKAYYYKSILGFLYSLRAGVYVYSFRTSDINYYTSGNAIKVNLWHGIALKEVEFRAKKGKMAYRYNGSLISRYRYPILYQKPTVLLNVGPRYSEILRESFKLREEDCITDMYPRCKPFFEDPILQHKRIYDEGGELLELYKRINLYRKVYFYMPTFRDTNRNLFKDGNFNFEELNQALIATNSIFVIKVHPNSFSNIPEIANFSNIYFVKRQFDVYPLLPFVTTLITDYSSIYFDVLLLKKEILLFPFDKDLYQEGDRELVFDYDKDIIGKKIYHFEELIHVIRDQTDLHLKEEDYKNLVESFWGSPESHKDIVNEIKIRYNIN